jgi:hypothetical protein
MPFSVVTFSPRLFLSSSATGLLAWVEFAVGLRAEFFMNAYGHFGNSVAKFRRLYWDQVNAGVELGPGRGQLTVDVDVQKLSGCNADLIGPLAG